MGRNFCSIFLLILVILLVSMQSYLSYKDLRHRQIQFTKKYLSKDKTLLEIPIKTWNNSSAIQKVEKHEIRYFGKMFDIISQFEKNGSIYLYGCFDLEEDYLLSLIHGNTYYELSESCYLLFSYFESIQELKISKPKIIDKHSGLNKFLLSNYSFLYRKKLKQPPKFRMLCS